MSDFISSLQRFTGGREGCFESATPKVDAVVVCHEARSVGLAAGEQIRVSFKVVGRPDRDTERFAEVGELCHLKSLQLDQVVLMSVWAANDDSRLVAAKLQEPVPPHRACGEVRLPLRHLVSKCDGALYHSWLMLDSPGLSDSVASIGLMENGDGEAFSQALLNAPRQLYQPKVCLSICKAEDLGPSGQPLWVAEATRKDRLAKWGPLLRSQQQHVVMCTAQHLQSAQTQREQRAQAAQQMGAFEEQATEQARELARLREALHKQQEGMGGEERPGRRNRDQEGEATQDVKEQQELGERLTGELAELQDELAKIGEEANSKIEAANVRIRALRQERDDAVREVERQNMEVRRMQEGKDELSVERSKLSEQKEALLKIVEDLHQTCLSAGLQMPGMSGRKSLDSFRFP